jgi:AraC-like DNA-binding protein
MDDPAKDMQYPAMNKRIQKFNEKSRSFDFQAETFAPPLKIVCAVLSRWGPGDHFSRQQRPTLSLSLITAGNATYRQEGRAGRVERGQVFLAHRTQSQQLLTGDAGFLHKRSVILEGAALDAVVAALRLPEADVVTPPDGPAVRRLFREIYRCLQRQAPDTGLQLSVLAWRLLLACAAGLGVPYPPELRLAVSYINRNVHCRPTVKAIAAQTGLSPRHCTRLFQAHLGCSPGAFCIRQRLASARNRVLNTSLSLKEIADELGYADQFHFSTQFRRHYGLSPSALRRQAPA